MFHVFALARAQATHVIYTGTRTGTFWLLPFDLERHCAHHLALCVCGRSADNEKGDARERTRERHTQRERDRERERPTERTRERRERRERDRDRDREREREIDREREREERERTRERGREYVCVRECV